MELHPLSGSLGAEVSGVDLNDVSADLFEEIEAAFVDHHVLVFRDQDLDPQAQVNFGRLFGELDTHPFVHMNAEHPEVLDVITEADDITNFGGGWHTDVTFLGEPDLGSLLYAVDVPTFGGDTLFANQHAAYDALSDTMKGMLEGLVAVHSAGPQYAEGGLSTKSKAMVTKNADRALEKVEHPVIRTHPRSGRKGLYVNKAFTIRIKGMRRDESDALLNFLFQHGTNESYTCRVRWESGTLTMWDNRSVQHFALYDYAGQRRHMRRITVTGDTPR